MIITKSIFMLLQSWLKRHDASSLKGWSLALETDIHNPSVTWIGHSTFLIKMQGLTIITDPIFGELSFIFKRMAKSPLSLDQLPLIDIVLISHNHRDHMDTDSLMAIKKRNPHVKVFVPQGDKAWFDRRGFNYVRECIWWEECSVPSFASTPIKLSFLPAYHWSQRGLFDRNKSLWGSWMIESAEGTIYFAGDTAYSKHFKAIGQTFPHIDIALMPVAPCEPHHWMKLSHVNAEEAGQGFIDLGARIFVPMHWGTFWFGTDHPLMAIERINAWWQKHVSQESAASLEVLKFGQTLKLPTPQSIITPEQPLNSLDQLITG